MNNPVGSPPPTIHVVDDDPVGIEAITRLVASMNIPTKSFDSAEAFLGYYNDQPGCVVSDHRLVGRTGLELQEELITRGFGIPVIIVTAFARTAMTVRAVKAGAVTVMDKPYSDDEMWQAIRSALGADRLYREMLLQQADVTARLGSLSDKERLVLERILSGKPNKTMANELEVSLRTIENRRRSIFTKLKVSSVAELVTLVLRFENSEIQQSNSAAALIGSAPES
ncbi:response regulator transcription factor [Adhaeretor mobilis]|uniref:Response regulator protein TmoT n=1 Tax=Adhaeretor mobilis TaxID=1930276 RepID=A0A517MR41_9BACT|nr:response regulator [Adhaeretor mobilis]QDS97340.1 Response regulator protein TmoT [Adhaeretor mobilis]